MTKKNRNNKPAPIIKSVSLMQTDEGWRSMVLYTQGDRVLHVVAADPDIGPIAKSAFKLESVKILSETGLVSKGDFQKLTKSDQRKVGSTTHS